MEVRLEGIDAPEHGQAFGDASRQHLSDLILGKQVNLDCAGQDRYGRWACNIAKQNRIEFPSASPLSKRDTARRETIHELRQPYH
ncbi:MAG: thermonuclease family protein [Candidatus Binataceae bacterium]